MSDEVRWRANPGQQKTALATKAFEILYGGARGGGKTDAGMAWMLRYYDNPRFRGLVIRRNADDLSDWVSRAKIMYAGTGADFAYRPTEITFPSGAIIRTGHLKDEDAYTKYQGHEYQRILIEELTQIPSELRYLQLLGSCRSTVPEIPARVFATTNPGGIGHHWVKSRFVDPSPWGQKFIGSDTQRSRIFIPAKVDDCPQLITNDPGYIKYLDGLKGIDEALWKAWRLGDWDTFVGQFFSEFSRSKHVLKSFEPNYNDSSLRFIGSIDWGRTAPFSFLATVVIEEKKDGAKFYHAITYKELYGTGKSPYEWAEEIKRIVPVEKFSWIRADPSIFKQSEDGSIGIADQFAQCGIRLLPADNNRISGWEVIRRWLSMAPDDIAYWLVTDNCLNLIRTLPEMVHDDGNVEDLDTDAEDHAVDALRYGLAHLSWSDAQLGTVKTRDSYPQPVQHKKIFDPTRPVNLNKFATAKRDTRDWRAI